MLRHTFVAVGLSGLLGGFWVNACSVDTNGAAPEPNEASVDGATTDSTADAMASADAVEPREATTEASTVPPLDAGDASIEAGATKCSASNCGGACCGDKCVASCQGCASGSLFCPFSTTISNSNGECVASCSSCQALGTDGGVACFSCGAGGTQGSCAATIDRCAADTTAGACPCAADAGNCPGATQVCVVNDGGTGACVPCGAQGTQGLGCSGGATCAEPTSTCQ
jgi:hypothetical protein